MKCFLIGLIKVYQMIPGPWHNMCIHIPTCSNYAIEAYKRFGVIRGTLLSVWRVLRCNPWNKGGYDPVPDKFTFKRENEKSDTEE